MELRQRRDRRGTPFLGGSGMFGKSFGIGGGNNNLDIPSFQLDLLSGSLADLYKSGSGTFTRSTVAWDFGSNGLLQSFAIDTPRFGYDQVSLQPKGLLIEPAGIQILATADIRDMTTANWTLGATMTRARTSVGADGAANSATRLTAGAVSATNTITYLVTAAATSRTFSALVRRITGTGVIRLTEDAFATNTDVTSQVPADGAYHLVSMTQSQLNAVIGFQLDTNTDAIDVDFNQFEAGGVASSRMATTGAARAADLLTYSLGTWYNAAQGTLYAEFLNPSVSGTYMVATLNDATGNNVIDMFAISLTTAHSRVATGGVVQSDLFAAAITGGAVVKQVNNYSANDFAGFANNTTLGTNVAGTIPTVTSLEIGSEVGGTQLGSYIRKIAYYPIRMNSAAAQALTVV